MILPSGTFSRNGLQSIFMLQDLNVSRTVTTDFPTSKEFQYSLSTADSYKEFLYFQKE
jgi:hypothetical protein